ncbi:MAG: hypothetical protein WBR13_06975, partial [Allosphingosinicella sp.]
MSPTLGPLPSLEMGRTTPLPGAMLLALLTAIWLAVAAPALAAGAPGTRTISNIATIEWEMAGGKVSQESNRVDLDVGPASSPISLAAFRFASGGETLTTAVRAPLCGAGGAPASLASDWRGHRLDPASLLAAKDILPGEPLLFVVDDAGHNRDSASVESIQVEVRAASGDSQLLTVFETAADSGKFAGFIQTQIQPAPAADDCRLSVKSGDLVTIAIPGAADRTPASATVKVLAPAIPVELPLLPVQLAKQASRATAAPGEAVAFTVDVRNPNFKASAGNVRVTDILPPALRLRPHTLRIDNRAATAEIAADGSSFTVTLPKLEAGAGRRISYAAEVKPGAADGDAVNRVEAVSEAGLASNVSDAIVRIRRDGISGRMTILGRVTDGGCGADPARAAGVAGVRVMLEDGSYAVTDRDGRYHFEGVLPGTHVVQLDDMTLPVDRAAADCARSSRSAGRAFSRFVDGRGGALKRVDFKLVEVAPRASLA